MFENTQYLLNYVVYSSRNGFHELGVRDPEVGTECKVDELVIPVYVWLRRLAQVKRNIYVMTSQEYKKIITWKPQTKKIEFKIKAF